MYLVSSKTLIIMEYQNGAEKEKSSMNMGVLWEKNVCFCKKNFCLEKKLLEIFFLCILYFDGLVSLFNGSSEVIQCQSHSPRRTVVVLFNP